MGQGVGQQWCHEQLYFGKNHAGHHGLQIETFFSVSSLKFIKIAILGAYSCEWCFVPISRVLVFAISLRFPYFEKNMRVFIFANLTFLRVFLTK